MNAGTFSLAMMTPLMKPTKAAPATAARRPSTTAGNRGAPALNEPRIASADSTEARLITQPTLRSMPAVMMTKVCPSPSSRTGTMATRMFCELRRVRKLTAPPLASGTAMTKNSTISPRKAQAQMRDTKSPARCSGVSTPVAAASALRAPRTARSLNGLAPRNGSKEVPTRARPPPPPRFGRPPPQRYGAGEESDAALSSSWSGGEGPPEGWWKGRAGRLLARTGST